MLTMTFTIKFIEVKTGSIVRTISPHQKKLCQNLEGKVIGMHFQKLKYIKKSEYISLVIENLVFIIQFILKSLLPLYMVLTVLSMVIDHA